MTEISAVWGLFLSSSSASRPPADAPIPTIGNFPLSLLRDETTIPVFPNLYGVYKKDKWAFSLGIGPVAGGGTAEFAEGIPTLEIPFSQVVPALAGLAQIDPSLAVTGYDLDMSFKVASTL